MSKSASSFTHFAFMPLNNFTMLAFSNAIEVLRMANYLEGKNLYRWSVVSPEGGTVMASNGLSVTTTRAGQGTAADVVFVCGGTDIAAAINPATLDMLQHLARKGIALGSLCTGAFALAQAGLLDGYTCATHWENLSTLKRSYPAISFAPDLFVIDRDRITCTGGIAPLDMMLNLISSQVGKTTIAAIADQFILEHVRDHKDQQRVPLTVRMTSARPAMVEVVSLMEANIEEPLSLDELAQLSNSSPRQLQRMFKEHMGMSPTHYYLTLRLRKARELLRQTDMSILSITVACGFQSACHFSKTYREIFSVAPSTERRQQAPVPAALLAAPMQQAAAFI
ncbi:transcriptional regulator, AraC family with amidase-like domain [Collimonas sp. OK242]|jgi:transcriptional regulator GlxA family with amidase domain|uniref:GlxA family transcriptional regulator n=1 Tax=Collimonas sp. OK242 TaxID=1798195 RepID=UPI0008957EB6|nr:GlxA family transcriptional regulator [Collimonas sp. OK242]SDY21557.1 transcriptional regulator, AraC family with amidase-like domain [Collimonas sp. OK242]